jgi:hypothetical protein
LLKDVARREFDIVAAWSVCRLGRSLPDLIILLSERPTPLIRLRADPAIRSQIGLLLGASCDC